jgi:vanillate O-demethylase monooxygenase subunit
MAVTVGLARSGAGRGDLVLRQLVNPHLVTPETLANSHYFYDHEATPEAAARAQQVLADEDEPMLEAAQEALGDQDLWEARPAILQTDAGAIRARRRLMQLRREEASDPRKTTEIADA